MSKELYTKSELAKYGNVDELTQATGGSGADLVVTGATTVTINSDGSVNTDGSVSPSVGSGVLLR